MKISAIIEANSATIVCLSVINSVVYSVTMNRIHATAPARYEVSDSRGYVGTFTRWQLAHESLDRLGASERFLSLAATVALPFVCEVSQTTK